MTMDQKSRMLACRVGTVVVAGGRMSCIHSYCSIVASEMESHDVLPQQYQLETCSITRLADLVYPDLVGNCPKPSDQLNVVLTDVKMH